MKRLLACVYGAVLSSTVMAADLDEARRACGFDLECSQRVEGERLLLEAEQGNAEAQERVGAKYQYGLGFRQDYVEELKWYRLAAEQGNVEAQTSIGLMYGVGHGVKQDYVEAA